MTPSLWISLALIWILFFWLYRDYRVDRFRQNLFRLRDDLFDLALDGRISFDHPAYGMLRNTINGTIRNGHRFGLIDLLCFTLIVPKDAKQGREYSARWKEHCESLHPDTREALEKLRSRLHINVVEQVILSSAVLVFTVLGAVAWLVVCAIRDAMFDRVRRAVSHPRLTSLFAQMDSSAAMTASGSG